MKRIISLVITAVLMLSLLTGCSAGMKSQDGNYYAQSEVAEAPAAYDNGTGMASEEAAPQEVETEVQEPAPAPEEAGLNYDGSILSPGVNRKIVYSASFTMRTKQFDTDYDSLLGKLQALGGYVESSSISGSKPTQWNESGRYAYMTLRVPSSKFNEFTGILNGIGETISKSVSGQDISLQYFDTETKLKTLRTREARLLELLGKATTMEDIVELEKALGDVSYEIQMLETNLRDYDSLIDYSTVTIEMQEVNQVASVTPEEENIGTRISNAFYSVLNVLADFGEFLLVFIIGGAPVIIPLAVIAVLVIILVKRRSKKLKAAQSRINQNDEQ